MPRIGGATARAEGRNVRAVTPVRLFLGLAAILGLYLLIFRQSGRSQGGPSINNTGSAGHSAPSSIQRRVVAVADLHGDLAHALSVLQMAEIVDAQGQWVGSEHDVLVSTGDIVDRGDDTIPLYRLFDQLRSTAGPDRVKNCLGNHEVMNALGDWRYITPGDVKSFGGAAARRRAMSTEGWIGQTWLANYSVSHTINLLPSDQIARLVASGQLTSGYTVPKANFVHGGIHPSAAANGGLAGINAVGQALLQKALSEEKPTGRLPAETTPEEARIWSEFGPFWYRGYAYEGEEEACKLAAQTRKALGEGVDYLVMGHTPHLEGFVHRCDPPSIHLIDTGISRAYGGEQSALIFETSLDREQHPGGVQGWTEHRRLVALYKGRRPRTIYQDSRKLEA
ncbi:unnamed protein product [Parajaminaea phylloscopi]